MNEQFKKDYKCSVYVEEFFKLTDKQKKLKMRHHFSVKCRSNNSNK